MIYMLWNIAGECLIAKSKIERGLVHINGGQKTKCLKLHLNGYAMLELLINAISYGNLIRIFSLINFGYFDTLGNFKFDIVILEREFNIKINISKCHFNLLTLINYCLLCKVTRKCYSSSIDIYLSLFSWS